MSRDGAAMEARGTALEADASDTLDTAQRAAESAGGAYVLCEMQRDRLEALAADVARQGEILQAVIVFMGQREMGSIYAGELLKELNAPSGNEDTSAL